MTENPPPPRSPMERQGALLQELAGVLLDALDLPDDWASVGAAFLPHSEGWAARLVITGRDGATSGGDAPFAEDSQITTLLNALQQASAEQREAFASLRLTASRSIEEPERIRLGTDVNYDRDPGSFDGVGGVDQQVARRFVERFGADAAPAWMRDLLSEH